MQAYKERTPILYGLPKNHKLDISIFENVTPDSCGYIKLRPSDDLKFRPVISSSYAPTSRLSSLIDEILKPLVPELRSYCRDTNHFMTKLASEPEISESVLLTSFDAVSLYTSIPHDLGMESINFWLGRRQALISDRFSNDFILSFHISVLGMICFYKYLELLWVQKWPLLMRF